MSATTKVGKFQVPLHNYEYPTVVSFSSGAKGKREKGHYAFWTTILDGDKRKRIWGRARLILPPGDRFDRMRREARHASNPVDRKAYARMWERMGRGSRISYIRPSTAEEVCMWMESHENDAKYIYRVMIGREVYEF